MIQCFHCNAQNKPTAKFCARCGKPLQVAPSPTVPRQPAIPPGGAPRTQVFAATAKLVIRLPGQAAPVEVGLSRGGVAPPMLTLGRAPNNDIVVAHPFVSAHHARLERVGARYRIVDLGSTNGLLLNGRRVQDHLLSNGDVIRIGDAFGNSVGLTYVDSGAPPASFFGRLDLKQPTTVIGRDPQATMRLDAPVVSWHHARIDWDGAAHTLSDLNSTNGTFVNGARVQKQRLNPNDVVQIGPFQLVYDRAGLNQFNVVGNVRLDAIGLRRTVQGGKKVLLNDVSLSVQPKEFVALVGGSGAGKTTLMNALSGFQRAEGQVLLNGADYYRQFEVYRAMLGYVPQDDIIHKGLPVASALRYAAELRLPPDASDAEIEQRIRDALAQVEIARQREQMVNSLSGGQRKRVSIAVELLAQPALFFLDEPTSGLDPGLEKKMMYTLRHLADGGQTIILVTHATANIDQCDLVAFMARSRLVFFGPPNDAKKFFQATDFSDIYSALEQAPNPQDPDQVPRECEARFKKSPYYAQYVQQRIQQVPAAPSKPLAARGGSAARAKASPLRQWWILARRNFELIVRDRLTLFILLAVMPIIGFLVLLIAERDDLVPKSRDAISRLSHYTPFGEAQKLLFIVALAAVLLGIFGAAYEIVREHAIYRRERMVNLGVVPYVLSKMSVLFLFSLIQAAALLLIIALKVRLPGEGAFLPGPIELYITLVLATLASIALGLFLSSLASSDGMVIYIILLVLFVQILFAGAIFDLPKLTRPLSWLTTTHWTLDALGSTVDMRHLDSLTILAGRAAPSAKELTINYGHTAKHLLSRWIILGGFAMIFTVLTCLRQKMKDV
jgi:ABC-type multidrug transport system ATPase subunit